MEVLSLKVYSTEPLSRKVRNFQLPDYPLRTSNDGPLPLKVAEFFAVNKIVYYRDDHREFGFIVEPDDGDETPISERPPWKAYKSLCVVDKATLRIVEFQRGRGTHEFRKLVQKRGDAFMWHFWNKEVLVLEMREEFVRCE